jgi:hypothetical protein
MVRIFSTFMVLMAVGTTVHGESVTSGFQVDKAEAFRTVDDLAQSADLVIVGTVSSEVSHLRLKPSLSSELNDEQRERLSSVSMPISVTGVMADDVLKGRAELAGQLVDVMQFGGAGHGVFNADTVGVSHLLPDTRVVLFLSRYVDPRGNLTDWYVILGVEDGMMLLDGDAISRPPGSESVLGDAPATLEQLRLRFSR